MYATINSIKIVYASYKKRVLLIYKLIFSLIISIIQTKKLAIWQCRSIKKNIFSVSESGYIKTKEFKMPNACCEITKPFLDHWRVQRERLQGCVRESEAFSYTLYPFLSLVWT